MNRALAKSKIVSSALALCGVALICSCGTTSTARQKSIKAQSFVTDAQIAQLVGATPERVLAAGRRAIVVTNFECANENGKSPIGDYLKAAIVHRLVADGRLTVIDETNRSPDASCTEAERNANHSSAPEGVQPAEVGEVTTAEARVAGEQRQGVTQPSPDMTAFMLGTFVDLKSRIQVHQRVIGADSHRVLASGSITIAKPRTHDSRAARQSRLRYKRWWGR